LLKILTLILIEMKKLNKLQINPEKVMKNEELLILRGGYGETNCYCICAAYMPDAQICGHTWAYAPSDCNTQCITAPGCEGGVHHWGECDN
jgi:hypothetical protein